MARTRYTSNATLSRGIPRDILQDTCIMLVYIHTSLKGVYAKIIQVTNGIFHVIPRDSVALHFYTIP